MKNILEVKNISKSFAFYESSLKKLSGTIAGFPKPRQIDVLSNISFNLGKSKSLGIIGLNGSGKSTFLKIISDVLNPSSGKFKLNGNVISILELGMGLNSEFTGRQNVYLAMSLYGIHNQEIEKLISNICKFSELGEYFDMPIKLYSSGMYLRLAFSIATAKRADVIIIDEALSVGDVSFQYKCFSRLNAFKKEGTSFIVVSHDKNTILQLCDEVLFLDKGKNIYYGNPMIAFDLYNAKLSEHQKDVSISLSNTGNSSVIESGNKLAELFDIKLTNKSSDIKYGSHISLKLKLKCNKNFKKLIFGIGVKDNKGVMVSGLNTDYINKNLKHLKKDFIYQIDLRFKNIFNQGFYSLQLSVQGSDNHSENNIHWLDNAINFNSVALGEKFVGYVKNNVHIKTNRLSK